MLQSDILFVFPPFCESALNGPHLAIPLLRGILSAKGVPSSALDLNIRSVRKFLEPEVLSQIADVARASSLSLGVKEQTIAAFDHVAKTPLSEFLIKGSVSLKLTMKYIRALVFPSPANLEDCLSNRYDRPNLATYLYDEFVSEILHFDPKIVCFSVAFGEQLSEAVELAHLLRFRAPEIFICIGGSQINLLQADQLQSLLESPLFDRVNFGNGESTILDSVTDQSSTKLKVSGPITGAEINELPHPVFDDLEQYLPPLSLPVLATKGCYWGQCTFCDYPKLSDIGDLRYIAKTPAVVLREIQYLQERFRPAQINLISDAIPPSWYSELADLAIQEDTVLNSWSFMMHHNSLTSEFFYKLARAGVKTINFGTESTIDRILDVMKKQGRYDAICRNLEYAHNAGIGTVSNVIIDYPTITRLEAYENARRFEELSPWIDSLNPQMFDLTAGTPASEDPKAFQLSVKEESFIKSSHGYHSISYERHDELQNSDRRVLERVFFQLKTKIVVRRRIESFARNEAYGWFKLDPTAIILKRETNSIIWLMSIGCKWPLSVWEERLLTKAFAEPERIISVSRLNDWFQEDAHEKPVFAAWSQSLIDSGLVVKVSNSCTELQGVTEVV